MRRCSIQALLGDLVFRGRNWNVDEKTAAIPIPWLLPLALVSTVAATSSRLVFVVAVDRWCGSVNRMWGPCEQGDGRSRWPVVLVSVACGPSVDVLLQACAPALMSPRRRGQAGSNGQSGRRWATVRPAYRRYPGRAAQVGGRSGPLRRPWL